MDFLSAYGVSAPETSMLNLIRIERLIRQNPALSSAEIRTEDLKPEVPSVPVNVLEGYHFVEAWSLYRCSAYLSVSTLRICSAFGG
jgi:hypothetical protein